MKKAITIRGLVLPVEWNSDGHPIRAVLSTTTEKEYPIDRRNKRGKELTKSLRQQVQVFGTINRNGTIHVESYIRIEEWDPEKKWENPDLG